jgi:hypothetical protein
MDTRITTSLLLCAGLTLAACSSNTTSDNAGAEPTQSGQDTPVSESSPAPQELQSKTGKAPLPLPSKDQCQHDELLLLQYPLEELMDGMWSQLCCQKGKELGGDRCNLDWPFSDVPDCDSWALLRNGIFARYGYPFQKTEWQAEFGRWDWYKRNEAFDAEQMSATARANIALLQRYETTGFSCQK